MRVESFLPSPQCRLLAKIAAQTHQLQPRPGVPLGNQVVVTAIVAAVIDEYHFERFAQRTKHLFQTIQTKRQNLTFVVERHDHANHRPTVARVR